MSHLQWKLMLTSSSASCKQQIRERQTDRRYWDERQKKRRKIKAGRQMWRQRGRNNNRWAEVAWEVTDRQVWKDRQAREADRCVSWELQGEQRRVQQRIWYLRPWNKTTHNTGPVSHCADRPELCCCCCWQHRGGRCQNTAHHKKTAHSNILTI